LQGRESEETITGAQIRAARALINMSVAELAEETGLAVNTIRRAEGTNGPAPITTANVRLLCSVFDRAGVLFLPADELGPGVRLARPSAPEFRPRRRNTATIG
jgi:transcriptional regulator with XRE-family HTH domain